MAPPFAGRPCHRDAPSLEQDYGMADGSSSRCSPHPLHAGSRNGGCRSSILLMLQQKTHRREDGGNPLFDALGEFHLLAALTKLSQSAHRTRFITGWIP